MYMQVFEVCVVLWCLKNDYDVILATNMWFMSKTIVFYSIFIKINLLKLWYFISRTFQTLLDPHRRSQKDSDTEPLEPLRSSQSLTDPLVHSRNLLEPLKTSQNLSDSLITNNFLFSFKKTCKIYGFQWFSTPDEQINAKLRSDFRILFIFTRYIWQIFQEKSRFRDIILKAIE